MRYYKYTTHLDIPPYMKDYLLSVVGGVLVFSWGPDIKGRWFCRVVEPCEISRIAQESGTGRCV